MKAPRFAPLLLVPTLILLAHPRAGVAQCPPATGLTSGVPVDVNSDPRVFSISPGLARWSAVGVRSGDGQPWHVEVRDATAPFPTCYQGLLTTQGGTGINFAVTDWRHRSLQSDFIGIATPGLNGTLARVEYEKIFFEYETNRLYDQWTFNKGDVLTVREMNLAAGASYRLEFHPSAGMNGFKVYVFQPVTSGSGWLAKSQRMVEQTLIGGLVNSIELTAPVNGRYGLVITNELASSGTCYFTVRSCPFGSQTLFDNVPYFSNLVDDWPGFTPPAHRWGVVGVRGDPGHSYNLDVAPFPRGPNVIYLSQCSDSVLAEQNSGLGVRLIAGDFTSLPLRLYTAHMGLEGLPKSNGSGYLEWEDGQDSLIVNAPATPVSPPTNNVLDAFTLRVMQGGTYHVTFTPNPGQTANYRIIAFRNPSPGTGYWATRPDAIADASAPTQTVLSMFAEYDGLYCVVIANENGGTGSYTIRATSDFSDAPSSLSSTNRIRAITPNPSAGDMRIDYELARAGRVALSVTNAAGRIVARLATRAETAGPGSLVWDGRAANGMRPVAGVYFVTLSVDDVPQDRRKTIVLH